MVTATRGNNIPRGGWGNKAPYKTTHKRIPEDLKTEVEFLVERYREIVVNGGVYTPLISVEGTKDEVGLTLDEALSLASQVKRHKKSGSESLALFIGKLFGVKVDKKDL